MWIDKWHCRNANSFVFVHYFFPIVSFSALSLFLVTYGGGKRKRRSAHVRRRRVCATPASYAAPSVQLDPAEHAYALVVGSADVVREREWCW